MHDVLHSWLSTPRGILFLRYGTGLSAVLYAASLAMPAVYFGTSGGWLWGIYLLVIGMFGYLGAHFAWYANVFYAVAAMFLRSRKPQVAVWVGLGALALAISFMFYDTFDYDVPDLIVHWGPGYYTWLAAIVVQIACAYGRTIAPGHV